MRNLLKSEKYNRWDRLALENLMTEVFEKYVSRGLTFFEKTIEQDGFEEL